MFGQEPPATDMAVAELADRYVTAWANRDVESLAAMYAPNVLVRAEITGMEWRSFDEMIAAGDAVPPLQAVPPLHVFTYEAGDQVEAVVVVQLGGDCPMLEARRWVPAGDTIQKEMRLVHVPSAQRCRTELPEGWWTTFVLPPDLQENVTEIVDVGGSLVDLVNAEPDHEAFVRWMFARFAEAGLGVPEVRAVWFPPSPDCFEKGGLAYESDERYEGRHTIVVCFAADRLTSDRSESGWFETAIANGLHELAHIWMRDHLTDETRAAFTDLVGLAAWRGAETPWRERGVEHAAFTISWSVTGVADARYPMPPAPSCEELEERYALLTGRQPITTCGEGGWSPPR